MGAAVGAVLRERGVRVAWASEGRSPETRARAEAAGLEDAGSAKELAGSDVLLSVCPPHAALEVARSVGPFGGLYVDANAVAPATARGIAEIVRAAGGELVDGGIVGSPPREDGTTRLYLSGAHAASIGELFAGSILDTRVVSDEVGAASALKMAYAGWTKGTAALLLGIRELARAEGVEEALLEEWDLSLPELRERYRRAARSADAKGWRWVGEMEEIAATFEAAGLPDGFHRAAAEVYRDR
jgi:3-hydroxyisobutyrate dehydrogenase-like beta-hydroxyacid dehydrogenase